MQVDIHNVLFQIGRTKPLIQGGFGVDVVGPVRCAIRLWQILLTSTELYKVDKICVLFSSIYSYFNH